MSCQSLWTVLQSPSSICRRAAKIESLLAQMSLDEKIGQTQAERLTASPQDVKNYSLGSILSGGGSMPGANRPADRVAMIAGFLRRHGERRP